MSALQKIIMWTGILIICGMGLYPPWTDTLEFDNARFEMPGEYGWIFSHPGPRPFNVNLYNPRDRNLVYQNGIRIDLARLGIQWICVALVALGVTLTLTKKA